LIQRAEPHRDGHQRRRHGQVRARGDVGRYQHGGGDARSHLPNLLRRGVAVLVEVESKGLKPQDITFQVQGLKPGAFKQAMGLNWIQLVQTAPPRPGARKPRASRGWSLGSSPRRARST
jgi:hypothetical protein